MPLGTEVDLGPGDVPDGDPALLPPKRAQPFPNFWPMSIVAKRLYVSGYQVGTDYGGRPQPRPHCLRWGPSSLP